MEHVTTELPDLLLNALSEPDRLRVERHLEECPSCREEWDGISSLQSLLSLFGRRSAVRPSGVEARHEGGQEILSPMESVPPGYFSSLPARILQRRQSGGREKSANWIQPVLQNYLAPLAAGILVILVLSQVSLQVPTVEEAAGLPVSPGDVVEYVLEDDANAVLEPISSQMTYLSEASLASQDLNNIFTPGLEDLESQSVQDLVSGLSDGELERLIARLNERAIL